MTYEVKLSDRALKHVELHRRAGNAPVLRKLDRLLDELEHHPRTGTGSPKQLKGDLAGYYSRRITQKHRLVYGIDDGMVVVLVVAAYGHYDDK